jgi:hypothetical protein
MLVSQALMRAVFETSAESPVCGFVPNVPDFSIAVVLKTADAARMIACATLRAG